MPPGAGRAGREVQRRVVAPNTKSVEGMRLSGVACVVFLIRGRRGGVETGASRPNCR